MSNGGYVNRLLRIQLSDNKITKKELDRSLIKAYLGGRGLGAAFLYNELEKGTDPLDSKNLLCLATGPLTGTPTPYSPKYCTVTKSPLTGTFTRSLSGGHFGPEMKFAGYDAIVIEGAARSPCYVWIKDSNVELKDAKHLWGKTTMEASEIIRKDLGDKSVKIASIGPAGENLVRFACVVNDGYRMAGRGGVGAVMGSKKLKAIAVRGSSRVRIEDSDAFERTLKEARASIEAHPGTPGRRKYGTTESVSSMNELGHIPTKNFQMGVFENAESIGGEAIREKLYLRNVTCFACPLACNRLVRVADEQGNPIITGAPQYETLALLGADCGNDDLQALALANHYCSQFGMDTISTGNVVAFAMECYERGLISRQETGGIDLHFGNSHAILEIVKRIGRREGFGDLLGEGVMRASQKIGKGASNFAMHVKGLELACMDPRGAQGMGLIYATANRGGCHTMGTTLRAELGGVSAKLEAKRTEYRFLTEGKAGLARDAQNTYALIDSMIFCAFSRYGLNMKFYLDFLWTVTGIRLSENDAVTIADRIYTLERLFNVREGFTRAGDSLPRRFVEEPMLAGPAAGQKVRLSEMLDDYYKLRGWDVKTGIPEQATLKALGIRDPDQVDRDAAGGKC